MQIKRNQPINMLKICRAKLVNKAKINNYKYIKKKKKIVQGTNEQSCSSNRPSFPMLKESHFVSITRQFESFKFYLQTNKIFLN